MSSLEVLQTRSRRAFAGSATERLGRRIVAGDVRPGDHLPTELDLVEELQVGRGVVREAIKALEAKGLVVSRPRTGTHVLERESWNFLDPDVLQWMGEHAPERRDHALADLRHALEPRAAALAAERATEDDVAAMVQAFETMAASAATDSDAFTQADRDFHAAVLRATHNDLFVSLGHALEVALVSAFTTGARTPGAAAAAVPKHELVLHAIRIGDPAVAAAAANTLVDASVHDIAAAGHGETP